MKNKLHKFTIVLIFLFATFSIMQAQYAIPSFNVVLEQANTTFEEEQMLIQTLSLEERQMVIEVEDNDPNQFTWAVVLIYSLDLQDEYGPFAVNEGTLLSVEIDDREWGVKVNGYLPGCVISAWIE